MSGVPDREDDVDWKAVVNRLREGKTAEIPYARARDYPRLAKQAAKRAKRRGLSVDVLPGDGVLRVEPRPAAGSSIQAQTSGGEAEL